MERPAPTFTPLPDFLYDIGRSLQYFKDHQGDVDPPMPRLIKQGRFKLRDC